jgi:hypothetical protein
MFLEKLFFPDDRSMSRIFRVSEMMVQSRVLCVLCASVVNES